MKKNTINEILIKQTKRRNKVISMIFLIILISFISIFCLLSYVNKNKDYYITYSEKSNIDYKVFLKNNDFFSDDYLGPNKRYIANLIDYITAKFNYQLNFSDTEELEYKYSYQIDALVDVKLKDTEQSMYNKTITLIDKKEKITNEKNTNIEETINIDYNYFNDLIKKFVSMYDLNGIESTLTINMYVNVTGECEKITKNSENESIISLSIPLTTDTIAIDLSDNLVDTENNVMQCKNKFNNSYLFLFFGIIFLIIDFGLIIYTISYELKTRTAENIYDKELKKILNNYGSYIQNLESDFDFTDYQILKLNNFTDMLEIRDTIRSPILMKENTEKNEAYFAIPSNTKILYLYKLMVSDIKRQKKD